MVNLLLRKAKIANKLTTATATTNSTVLSLSLIQTIPSQLYMQEIDNRVVQKYIKGKVKARTLQRCPE